MIEHLTNEELIIFLKVRVGQKITDEEIRLALRAVKRECPMFFYDQMMSGELRD